MPPDIYFLTSSPRCDQLDGQLYHPIFDYLIIDKSSLVVLLRACLSYSSFVYGWDFNWSCALIRLFVKILVWEATFRSSALNTY